MQKFQLVAKTLYVFMLHFSTPNCVYILQRINSFGSLKERTLFSVALIAVAAQGHGGKRKVDRLENGKLERRAMPYWGLRKF